MNSELEFKYTNKIAKTFLVKDIKNILKFLNKRSYFFTNTLFSRFKKSNIKFKYIKDKTSSSTVFVLKKHNLVIKISGCCSSFDKFHLKNLKFPNKSIPTAILKVNGFFVRIQPLANISNSKVFKFIKKANKEWSPKNGFKNYLVKDFGKDIKIGNLGVWNDKIVTLDW